MPRKNMNGTTATIEEVIELHELGTLAEDWASAGTFPKTLFDRYQELCRKYGVDAAELLFTYQRRTVERETLPGDDDDVSAFQLHGVVNRDGDDDTATNVMELPSSGKL